MNAAKPEMLAFQREYSMAGCFAFFHCEICELLPSDSTSQIINMGNCILCSFKNWMTHTLVTKITLYRNVAVAAL